MSKNQIFWAITALNMGVCVVALVVDFSTVPLWQIGASGFVVFCINILAYSRLDP